METHEVKSCSLDRAVIASREDYILFYKEDLRATGLNGRSRFERFKDKRYKFYKYLRKAEYYTNCRRDAVGRALGKIVRYRYYRLCERYSWTIPVNVFGKGLQLVHSGAIVVSGDARVGDYARVHVGVNIGRAYAKGQAGAPVIGDRCYFGPGCKLFGPIVIGDDVAIGANAVVNSSFPEGKCTLGGVPAKKISDHTSERYIIT